MSASTSPEVKFFQLPPNTIETLWPMLEKRLDAVIKRLNGRITGADMFRAISTGRQQCWTAWEGTECLAAVVTRITVHPTGLKALEALVASGDFREKWQYLAVDTLTDFMRAEGCTLFEIHARPGWERVLAPKGFKRTNIVLELEVPAHG